MEEDYDENYDEGSIYLTAEQRAELQKKVNQMYSNILTNVRWITREEAEDLYPPKD